MFDKVMTFGLTFFGSVLVQALCWAGATVACSAINQAFWYPLIGTWCGFIVAIGTIGLTLRRTGNLSTGVAIGAFLGWLAVGLPWGMMATTIAATIDGRFPASLIGASGMMLLLAPQGLMLFFALKSERSYC